ncbi:MAG: hypothetical protein ACOZNI_34035 [Myxococcota bacterium]
MSLPLCIPVAAAQAWADTPVATELHPVVHDYGATYQDIVTASMGGPRGSGVFGPIVAEADLHWRLEAATGAGLPLDPERAADWRDAALAGSVLSIETLLDRTLDDAPVLHAVYAAADAVVNPSLDAVRTSRGTVRVEHRTGGKVRRDIERREIEDLDPWLDRRPQPAVHAGVDWTLREDDAPEDAPLLSYAAYLTTSHALLTSFQARVALADLQWSASAREQFYPRLFVIGSVRSVEAKRPRDGAAAEVPELGRWSAGVLWALPWDDAWNVRLERITTLESEDAVWMVTLRGEYRTPIPARLDPKLGDRGYGGLSLPEVQRTEANATAPW